MSGANRPAGPATPKSEQLAKQISRDEMERNLPDALWGQDDDGDNGAEQRDTQANGAKDKDKSKSRSGKQRTGG
jgi:hypothetical protein